MIVPPRTNQTTGPELVSEALRASLARVEDVQVLDVQEDGGQIAEPSYGLERDEFALKWHFPCIEPSAGTVDAYQQPFSREAQFNQMPPVTPGAMPLDHIARQVAQTFFQQVIKLGAHPHRCAAWYCDDTAGLSLIPFKMGGYTFVVTVGSVGGREDQVEVIAHVLVDINVIDPLGGRHVG